MMSPTVYFKRIGLCVALFLLSGCQGGEMDKGIPQTPKQQRKNNFGKFLGEDALSFGGRGKAGSETGAIGVNSFLWHAVLDTFSYMPLIAADPFGGVIITDWYSPEDSMNERFKIDIAILSRQLRSDGLRISVFRQVKVAGVWEQAQVDPAMAKKLEDIVLVRARQLKIGNV